MDVGCPKCQTEYELEDARVPEDGVTVKCTTCGHVFRVKKKSLVVTLPVREGEAAVRQAQAASDLPPAPPSREWKIRQPGGNLFTCRELTTLQKWIIEGKVGRDDEISLTGDTWKRLGNIPELASFFQVFEEAKKARALDALGAVSPPGPSSPTAPGAPPKITDTWREPGFAAPPPPPMAARPEPPVGTPPPSIRETMREPQFSVPPPPPPPAAAQPPPPSFPPPSVAPAPQRPSMAPVAFREGPTDDDWEKAVKGGGGKWMVLVLVGLALGGGAGWYFGIYVPEQKALEAERNLPPEPTPVVVTPPAPAPEVVDAGAQDAGAQDAGAEVDAGAVVASTVDAGPPEVDAGLPGLDAGAPDAGKPEPKRSYEYFMSQGDRLRDREKPEAALDMYGQAAELKPNRAEPLAGRGLALLDMGNHLAAQAAFEEALKMNSRYGPAIMGMAEAYRLQGKNDKAIEYYQRYLDVLPNGAEASVARNNIERLKK